MKKSPFAENLKKAMSEAGINQKQLQVLTGLSKSGISQYCSGKVKPGKSAMNVIAGALNVSVEYLCNVPDDAEIEELTLADVRNIPVPKAARLMGVGQQFIREGLKRGTLPFGAAVLFPSGKYRYYISPIKFTEFTGVEVQ